MCEINWLLTNRGFQCLYETNDTNSVIADYYLKDCRYAVINTLMAFPGTTIGNYGEPEACITLKIHGHKPVEPAPFHAEIIVTDKGIQDEHRHLVATAYLLLYGWAENYGIKVTHNEVPAFVAGAICKPPPLNKVKEEDMKMIRRGTS